MEQSIQVLITGGTFDKEYDELTGRLFFKETHLHEMLTLGRSRLPLAIQTLMMKDSLEFDEADRKAVHDACIACGRHRVVITHGTDTMAVTAEYLAARNSGQTIVLTGAMVPYKFGSSDGLFNLGSALAFVQVLSPGVYVAMNGRVFAAGKVRKNTVKGEFEAC